MGTRSSRHNKGRKPNYKDHRAVAMHLLDHPRTDCGSWAWTRTHWTNSDELKVDILAEADADIEGSADALGRSPTSIAWRARDMGLTLPSQWSRLIRPKYKPKLRTPKPAALEYPYIIKPRNEHADLMVVNAIVPKGIPDNMRADMCQEILLAILEGRTSLEMLKARGGNASFFIKKFYHDNYEAGGHAISFNATNEEWNSDQIASSIAAKEWHREQFAERTAYQDTIRTFTPPTQFEAAWRDQIGRYQLKQHELGQFLSEEEVEEMLDDSP